MLAKIPLQISGLVERLPVLRLQPSVDPMELVHLPQAAFDFHALDHVASRFRGTRARRLGVAVHRHARRIGIALVTNDGAVTGIQILLVAMLGPHVACAHPTSRKTALAETLLDPPGR